jgi:hypothetical protein
VKTCRYFLLSAAALISTVQVADATTSSGAVPGPPWPPGDTGVEYLVISPNRFGLPPFYELHVWARRPNQGGASADWNAHMSCEC